ncbi:MAG TPA: hypothetical protein VFL57_00945 [Bryobacteraceae bacterium]|nr:hypothetical protein [Bryobacteraceae bacterium]
MPFSADFLEKLILLALSAFAIPFVLKFWEQQRAVREKDRDAARLRQDKLIQAQTEFLDQLTQQLWRWRYLTMRVTYYGGTDVAARYGTAREAYDNQIWDVLNDIRFEISKSRRLVSVAVHDALRNFYNTIVEIDRDLLSISAEADPTAKKLMYTDMNHKVFSSVSESIDKLVETVAVDLGLSTHQSVP